MISRQRRFYTLSTEAGGGLTKEQIKRFKTDGYLHLSKVWTDSICDTLRARAEAYVDAFDLQTVPSIFTTNDQVRESDDYFLTSGGQIRCFFEEHAFQSNESGDRVMRVPKGQAINKLGHGLHDRDAVFQKHSYSSAVRAILKSLGYIEPIAPQSMYIFKQPSIGGEVRPHQDGTFLFTEPQSVLGFWWALEDCTCTNGCLWGIPGSHRNVPISQRFRRSADGSKTVMDPIDTPVEYATDGAVPILTKKGDMVLLHHAFVHFSHANTSNQSRHAYAMHVVESANTTYPADNWLQLPPGQTFSRVYDA